MLHSSARSSSSHRRENSTTVRSQSTLRLARAALQTAFALSDNLGASLAERLFTSPRRFPRPERERAVLASGRPFTVDVALRAPRWGGQRCRVAAWRWGHGPAVLLVHGWEGRGSQLALFVEPLVAAGLSVVAFDAPGHGDSAGSRAYLTDIADAIIDVAAAAGPLHATIAHSFGAAALLLAHARGGVDAARNVMIAPNVLLDHELRAFARTLALDEPERLALERAVAASTGITISELHLERLATERDAALLVIHDRADREIAAAHGEALAGAWPAARLHLTEGLGHRRVLRDPDVIARAVAFAREGTPAPISDLVREVDRALLEADGLGAV